MNCSSLVSVCDTSFCFIIIDTQIWWRMHEAIVLMPAHAMFAPTAHPLYSQDGSLDTYNVAVELGLNGPRVNLIRETTATKPNGETESKRTVVSSFASDGAGVPYFHSFGLSRNCAVIVIVVQLRTDLNDFRELKHGFLRLMKHVGSGSVVLEIMATLPYSYCLVAETTL